MAANPNLPPQTPAPRQTAPVRAERPGHFPWGLVAAIIVIVCLGLIAYYFFR